MIEFIFWGAAMLGLGVVIGAFLEKRRAEQAEMPYGAGCQRCSFHVKSRDPEVAKRLAIAHYNDFHSQLQLF